MSRYFALALAFIILSGCSSNGVHRSDINQFVEVIYARVVQTKPVKFDSKADEAAVTGAIDGAIENSFGNSDDIIGGAIAGAFVSALFVSVEEGSREGMLVDLISTDNSAYHIVVNQTNIHIGECLQLIKGNEVTVIHVDTKFCQLIEDQNAI